MRSRVALYKALLADGWEAPAQERAILDRDAALLDFEKVSPETIIRLVDEVLAG